MTDFHWDVRTKHLYIPGMSGYGKTSLMANLALDDIEAGDCSVIVIDPKGSADGLVERVYKHIPYEMVPRVFYISLRHPVPIDFLSFEPGNQFEKNMVKGDIITILQRFSFGQWGTTMQATLNNLVPTLLEASDTTFLDIANFLESRKRHEAILKQVSPVRQEYWEENKISKADVGPIASRMSNFKEPPLSEIVSAPRGTGLAIDHIIQHKGVLLVDCSPLSDEGKMLGALIMSRIQQAIFRRSPNKQHPLCCIYADEFQNFQTSAFNVMLSQARSFNLSLCLANQHPKQITDIWDDIIGCVSTYCVFKMDGAHARMLESKLGNELWGVPNLDVGQAIFVPAFGSPILINVVPPPEPRPPYYLKEITENTARYSQLRAAPCDPSTNPHTKGDGRKYDKPEEIRPDNS